jgi:hypothetical protein
MPCVKSAAKKQCRCGSTVAVKANFRPAIDLPAGVAAEFADLFISDIDSINPGAARSGFKGLAMEYYSWLMIAALNSDDSGSLHYPPGVINSIWMKHLMTDTKKYMDFCATHFGKPIHFQVATKDKQTKRARKDAAIVIRRTMPNFDKRAAMLWGADPQSDAYNNIPTGHVMISDIAKPGAPAVAIPFHPDYTFKDLAIKQGLKGNYVVNGRLVNPDSTLGSAGVVDGGAIMTVQKD